VSQFESGDPRIAWFTIFSKTRTMAEESRGRSYQMYLTQCVNFNLPSVCDLENNWWMRTYPKRKWVQSLVVRNRFHTLRNRSLRLLCVPHSHILSIRYDTAVWRGSVKPLGMLMFQYNKYAHTEFFPSCSICYCMSFSNRANPLLRSYSPCSVWVQSKCIFCQPSNIR
jgi:hypothetical protein